MSDFWDSIKNTPVEGASAPSSVSTINGRQVNAPVQDVDADTFKAGGVTYRREGFNAPETAKIRAGVFTPGERSNDTSQADVNAVRDIGGFNNIQTQGKDRYGRTIAREINASGQRLGNMLTALGIADTNAFSDPEAIKEGIELSAASTLFPTLAAQDPLLALAMKRKEEQKGSVQYVPKMQVKDEATYAAYKSAVGVGAAAKEEKEVERLEGILATESLSPATRSNLTTQLNSARDRLFIAATTPDTVGGVSQRKSDRTINNQAYNQFTTSLHNGALEVLNSIGGLGELVGEETKWDWLKEKSKTFNKSTAMDQQGLATTLSSLSDIKTDSAWGAVKDTTTFMGNMLAGSLPMMAALIGGSAAVAAAGTAGAAGFAIGALPAALLYTGGIYNDQPEDKKNPQQAVALGVLAATLDKLGLDAITGKGITSLADKSKIVEAVKAQAREKGAPITDTAASKLVDEMSKKAILEIADSAKDFAKLQYGSTQAAIRGLQTLAKKGGAEGLTETAQTYAEMLGSTGVWSTDIQYEKDFYKNLLDAAVAGSGLGAGFGGIGIAKDAMQWHVLADGQKVFTKELEESQMYQADNMSNVVPEGQDQPTDLRNRYFHDIPTAMKAIADERLDESIPGQNEGEDTSIRLKTTDFDINKLPAMEGTWNGIKAIVTDPLSLLRQLAHTAIPNIYNEDGTRKTFLGLLKANMGGYGILPGEHAAGTKQRTLGYWGGNTAEELANRMKVNVGEANAAVKEAWSLYWSQGEPLPQVDNTGQLIPRNVELQNWKENMDIMRGKMIQTAAEAGVPFDEVMDEPSMFESASVHAQTLAARKNDIIKGMMQAGSTKTNAKDTVQALLTGNHAEAKAARDELSKYGLLTDPKFADVFETNLFTSIENIKDKLSTRIMNKKHIGENGEILTRLLLLAKENGEFDGPDPEAQFQFTVKQVRDWYQIMNGSYNTLDKYPKLQKVLGWGTTLTMLASLGKAALSSKVEVAMSTLGTPAELINKQLITYSKTFLNEYRSDINKFSSWSMSTIGISAMREIPDLRLQKKVDALEKEAMDASKKGASSEASRAIEKKIADLHKEVTGRSLFERLGFNETGYNTQSKFEYADSNMRRTMQLFASTIGLRAQTDSTRIALLTVASDIVVGKITSIMQLPPQELVNAMSTGRGLSMEQAQSLKELQSYGLNIVDVINWSTENETKDFNRLMSVSDMNSPNLTPRDKAVMDNIATTLGNMVDARIVNPQAHNLPKYFQDPRLRLFTAMTRFMATAHATVLPRLYRDFIVNGSVGMRYQAFSTVAMALLFAALMNGLKDELSYGEDSPYIQGTRKNVQRTLFSSSLAGQYERLIDQVMPLYDSKGKSFQSDPLGATVDRVASVSPVLTWAARPVRAALAIGDDRPDVAVKQLARATPLIGSFPVVSDVLSDPFKKE